MWKMTLTQPELATLASACKWENRDRVVRLALKSGEILHIRCMGMPCECPACTDNLLFYELIWSSVADNREKWMAHRLEGVGGYGIELDVIDRVEELADSAEHRPES